MRRRSAALAARALITIGLAACGPAVEGPSPFVGPSSGAVGVSSDTEVERFFPLIDGNVYHYVGLGEKGAVRLVPARVFRADATHGELRLPSSTRRFEYTEGGVKLLRDDTQLGMLQGGFVLKAPLEAGSTWRGEHGGVTTIVDVAASVEVPAGRFAGCIQTIEDRRGDHPIRYVTTFCRDIGVVVLEAQGGGDVARFELKSYGPPPVIGPDGLVRIQ